MAQKTEVRTSGSCLHRGRSQ